MKQIWIHIKDKFTWKKLLLASLFVVCTFCALLIQISRTNLTEKLEEGKIYSYWSEGDSWAQVSCFFSSKESIRLDDILGTRYNLEKELKEASIVIESDNPSARLYVDAYSANGEVSVSYGTQTFTGNAYGVGGDFFAFHPLDLIYGSYFTETDLMDDYVIIDREIAWDLFGSSNVVGKYVTIQEIPHKIVGVYKRPDDAMNRKAGNDKATLYLSYNSLDMYGTNRGINTYEVMMPNPVTGFAMEKIKDIWGKDELSMIQIENSKRYTFSELWQVIRSFPERSMNKNSVVYPVWENVERGYEDILARRLKYELAFLVIPLVLVITWSILQWKKLNARIIKRRNERKLHGK